MSGMEKVTVVLYVNGDEVALVHAFMTTASLLAKEGKLVEKLILTSNFTERTVRRAFDLVRELLPAKAEIIDALREEAEKYFAE
uniref:HE-B11 n=1 Tax=synthetic construct TaxID=32630 RepID=UPI003B642B58